MYDAIDQYMKNVWPDLNNVIIYADVSAYQVLGFLTIALSIFNILCYIVAAFILWRATHRITEVLKHKIIMDACLASTTVLMGIAAFIDAEQWFWQISYIARVGLLLIAPVILYRVVEAFLTIINTFKKNL